jgi:hypothetical protein
MALETINLFIVMVGTLFFLGVFTFIVGLIVLISRTFGRDVRTLATQTNRLAQKGLLDGIAGLVGNASALMEATNQLVKTARGIGAFLMFFGLFMSGTAIILYMKFT